MTHDWVALVGPTFTLDSASWYTGYPGIWDYHATLTLRTVGGKAVALVRSRYVVEREGDQSAEVETVAAFTGIGRDGTFRLTLADPIPEGPRTIKLDPRTLKFATAGGLRGFRESRTLSRDGAEYEADVLRCLRAICQSWEPGFEIPESRIAIAGEGQTGFVEGDDRRHIVTEHRRSEDRELDGRVRESRATEYRAHGLRPPADLKITIVEIRTGSGPWSPSVYLGECHEEDYVDEAVRIFDDVFSERPLILRPH